MVPGLATPVRSVAKAQITTKKPASSAYVTTDSAAFAPATRSPRAPGPERARARCTRFARTATKESVVTSVRAQCIRARVEALGEAEEEEMREVRMVTLVAFAKKAMAVPNWASERMAGGSVRTNERLLTMGAPVDRSEVKSDGNEN